MKAVVAVRESEPSAEKRIARWRELLADPCPRKWALHLQLGSDLEELGHLDEALEWYAKGQHHAAMARVYLRLGQREKALASLKRAATKDRFGPEILLLEAETYGELGEVDAVGPLLKLAFCRTPDDAGAPHIYQRIRELAARFAAPLPPLLAARSVSG